MIYKRASFLQSQLINNSIFNSHTHNNSTVKILLSREKLQSFFTCFAVASHSVIGWFNTAGELHACWEKSINLVISYSSYLNVLSVFFKWMVPIIRSSMKPLQVCCVLTSSSLWCLEQALYLIKSLFFVLQEMDYTRMTERLLRLAVSKASTK